MAQLETLLASIQDGLLILDADRRCIYANEAAAALFRTTTGQLLGKVIWDALPGARQSQFHEECTRSAEQGIAVKFEDLYEPLGRWYEYHCYPADGDLIVFFSDATGHKQVEEALLESRQVLEMAIAGSNAGVWRIDLDPARPDVMPNYAYLSPQLKALIGFEDHEFPNSRSAWFDRIVPEDVAHMEESARAYTEGRAAYYQAEFRIRHKDGRFRWLSRRGRLYRDEFGRPIRWAGIDWDITERKQAEETLRESEQRYRSFVQSSPGIVYQGHLNFVPVFFHGAVRQITGYTEQEFTAGNPRWDQVIHPQDLPLVMETGVELYTTPGYATEREYRIVRKDRQIRWVHELIQNICDDSGTPNLVQGAIYDVTERKHMEAELQQWNEHLELQVAERTEELTHTIDRLHEEVNRRMRIEAERQKAFVELEKRARQLQQLTLELSQAEDRERKRLAEILHGDLQQLLAAAKFHLGLLNSRIQSDNESQKLAAMTKDLLQQAIDKSRNLSHELRPPALSHNDLSETFEWLAEQVQMKHGLTVHLETRDRVTLQSEPLKALLYKAAQEMLFNVIKHAGVKEARLRLRRLNGRIHLSVADQGRGFDMQATGQAGFGLLSIRERIQLLGGRVKVSSAQGKGSIFVLVVPDAEPRTEDRRPSPDSSHIGRPASLARDERRAPTRSGAAGSGETVLRVLLVDDHKIVRQGIEAMLAEEPDVTVVGQAANGREAVDLAHRLQPDVIVMDVAMPVMAGDEATRQIKQHLPHIRVIALSMFDDARVADRMRKAGAAAYLLKTAPAEELLDAIRGNEAVAQKS